MVAAATCLDFSAVLLPLSNCQTESIAFSTTMAMGANMVEQLKQRLKLVVDNEDQTAANDVITQLEKATLSKAILESTRIGRYINEVRKQTADRWPEFSKRCRAIIKQWQKLAEYRPSSSCEGSSNGGTPQLVSPALRRGLTPRTPGKQGSYQRVTSTELLPPVAQNTSTGSSKIISPALIENGVEQQLSTTGVAKKISPQMLAVVQQAKHLQKSASIGYELSSSHEQQAIAHRKTKNLTNGAAFDTESIGPLADPTVFQTGPPSLTLKLKRSASGVQRLSISSSTESSTNGISLPVALQSSVQAARKNVQSTAELIAQLSEQLPDHIGGIFDRSVINEPKTSENVPAKMSLAVSNLVLTNAIKDNSETLATTTSRKRKKTSETITRLETRSICDNFDVDKQIIASQHSVEFSVLSQNIPNEQKQIKKKRGRPRKENSEQVASSSTTTTTEDVSIRSKKFNWFNNFPITDVEKQRKSFQMPREVYDKPEHSFILPIRERRLLMLPYLDTGLPDWLVHDLPEKERFFFPDPDKSSNINTK